MNIYEILKQYYGYDSFRWNQESAVTSLLEKHDIVYTAKTWDGKSICFQIPAIMSKYLTIVISPLKSLMKDQVESLLRKWVDCIYLNSDLDIEEYKEKYSNLLNWQYKLLYISPEKITQENFLQILIEHRIIDYLIIDEFDTIYEYGSSWFRESFLELWKIKDIIQQYQDHPLTIWIFTATSTKKTLEITKDVLWLSDDIIHYKWELVSDKIFIQKHYFDTKVEKDSYLYNIIKQLQTELVKNDTCMVIFCTTTKQVDSVYQFLNKDGFNVARFHSKMNSTWKESAFNKFMSGKVRIMICTNAFWRGIDKKNIQYVIHYGLPWSISSYLQEVWRWGRDWSNFTAITLFCKQDISVAKLLCWRNSDQLEEHQKLLDLLFSDTCIIKGIHNHFDIDYNHNCMTQCNVCTDEQIESKWVIKEVNIKKVKRTVKKTTKPKKVVKKKIVTKTKRK